MPTAPGNLGIPASVRRTLIAAVVFSVSLLLTGVIWWVVREQGRALAELQFAQIADEITDSIADRMRDYEQILRGGVAFIYASEEVTRNEWRSFVERLRVEENYPGIQGIGFAVRVEAARLAAHEAAVRTEGFHDYFVRPPGMRQVTYPIIWLEPFDYLNRQAFGYDMFSEVTRRAAMERARDTGDPAVSGPVKLVQEITADVQVGVLLYLPVYESRQRPETVDERREQIVGFVYSPFRLDDLIGSVVGDRLDEVEVRVYDSFPGEENRLFGPQLPPLGRYANTQVLDVFGRNWHVAVTSTPPLERTLASMMAPVVLVAGFVMTVLLTWLAYARAQERSRRIALMQSNADLIEAQRKADAAATEKTRFLASASHDIRQPVQSIALLLSVLRKQLAEHPSARLLDQLDRSLDGLREMLNGLLEISKLDAGAVVPEFRPVSVDKLLNRLQPDYVLQAEEKQLDFRIVHCSAWVWSDPALLERVLRNIVENAIRYTEAGGVLIGCRRRGRQVVLQVIDSGIGIHREHQDAIFQEFFQVGNPERDRSKGLGIGLSIVRRLVRLLEHRLDVTSQPHRGTTFAVVMDSVAAAPEPVKVEPEIIEPVSGLRALVIDDEAMVRDGLAMLLREWGCDVIAAADAVEAAALAGDRPPDVVLADYRLREGLTGIDAVGFLRQRFNCRIPAVILTGDTAPERVGEAIRSGFQILHKPVTAYDLERALADAVRPVP